MRKKSGFKNVRLSKDLASLGWKQVEDNKWIRVFTHKGLAFEAVIRRTQTRTFTSISPAGWVDRISAVAAQCSDPLEAASLYPDVMMDKALGSMQAHAMMADAADRVADALEAVAKRRKKHGS